MDGVWTTLLRDHSDPIQVASNGPVLRGEIDPWLSREAVAQFMVLLA